MTDNSSLEVPHIAAGKGVTIPVAKHPANTVGKIRSQRGQPDAKPKDQTEVDLIPHQVTRDHGIPAGLWGTSFKFVSKEAIHSIRPKHNGFVDACKEAYNVHKHLIIRPDDVWLAISAQFSCYVNAHAEELRSNFVAHEGKKTLEVEAASMEMIIRLFEEEIRSNIKDPEVVAWLVPEFSTTTREDKIAAIGMTMATMKAYFNFVGYCCCGLPSVTLLGNLQDWEKLYAQLGRLLTFKINNDIPLELQRWHDLLEPVLFNMLESYKNPTKQSTVDFWQKICHYSGGGSGPTYLSGWLTAFTVFDSKGRWRVHATDGYYGTPRCEIAGASKKTVKYPYIESEEITQGWTEVDITIVTLDGKEHPSVLVAGSIGAQHVKIVDGEIKDVGDDNDGLRPVVGWWCFSKPEKKEGERLTYEV